MRALIKIRWVVTTRRTRPTSHHHCIRGSIHVMTATQLQQLQLHPSHSTSLAGIGQQSISPTSRILVQLDKVRKQQEPISIRQRCHRQIIPWKQSSIQQGRRWRRWLDGGRAAGDLQDLTDLKVVGRQPVDQFDLIHGNAEAPGNAV